MPIDIPDYEPRFLAAVRGFWEVRENQAKRQQAEGKLDAGTRGAVTGGQHLNEVALLVADVFADAGIQPTGDARLLPGYYRASKNWDVVVTYKGAIVAVIELKSQVGSFGNNLNNRIEEMIGQSLDLWRAVREHLLGPVRPWFGYLMVLESHERSRLLLRTPKTAYPVDPEFIEGLNHHDASSDAWACASIAEAAVRERGAAGLPELLDQMSIFPGHLAPGLFDRADHGLNHLPRKPTAGSTPDPDHPFYGRKLVLTGGLGSISRHDAQQAIIDVGGKPSTSVSKFTDFLVVGGEFHGLLRNHQSHKLESALALRAQGASIELLNERDFLSTLLGGS